MPGSKGHSWKILGIGRGAETAEKAEKYMRELNFPNAKVIALQNDKASDDKFIEILKSDEWDGVSVGGGINGFDDAFEKEVTTLHWFNRIVNLVHEHAPKAKLIFVTGPNDIADAAERVLGAIETPTETV
ncbi:hypothetical protein I4U23_002831 [Adineta vaga]|nr:hypothetical protein I4U23_002831 [Adineta vaga]